MRITLDSGFKHPIKITMSDKRRAQQRIGIPPELVRDYTVRLKRGGEVTAKRAVTGNIHRLNVLRFDHVEADTIELMVTASNGCQNARVFRVAAYK